MPRSPPPLGPPSPPGCLGLDSGPPRKPRREGEAASRAFPVTRAPVPPELVLPGSLLPGPRTEHRDPPRSLPQQEVVPRSLVTSEIPPAVHRAGATLLSARPPDRPRAVRGLSGHGRGGAWHLGLGGCWPAISPRGRSELVRDSWPTVQGSRGAVPRASSPPPLSRAGTGIGPGLGL